MLLTQTRLPGGSPCIKMGIYTVAVQDSQPNWLYRSTRLPCVDIKFLFTQQPFKSQFRYIRICRVSTENRYLNGSHLTAKSAIYIAAGYIQKSLFSK